MADTVSDAQTLYSEAIDALRQQREQIADDLKFSDPSDPQQWDDVEKRRRETDPGGMRPCLVFDQCGQYVANVAGQVEQRPPSLHALPVGGGADKKTAEQLDGHFRHIEHASKAQQHYARAATSAARAGVGYLVVRPEYVDRALGYQEPRIGSEGDPMRVILDPYSVELDGSDARFGFILQPISTREYKRRWPKAELVSFGDKENYRARKDDRDNVIVAEYWQMDEEEGNCIIFMGLDGDEVALPEEQFWEAKQRGQVMRILGTYKEKRSAVTWRRLSGAAVLDKSEGKDGKEAAFPSDHIGIIPVYGYVGFADGRMTYCGIPRRARMPQQAYNYHMSEARAYTATAPKAPWVASVRALRGFESLWDRASVESRAYLPYNDLDEEGAISQPQRMAVSADVRNHMQGAEQALRDIQSSLGLYQANLGAPSNETSGVAIESRKQQGEASTAHFQTHLAASVAHVGNICLQMVQRLVDTRRQLRILSIDSQPSTITINPQQQSSVEETPQGLSINPNVGRYDVRVVVGAAYSTQRQQAQQAFTEMMRASPNLAPAIAPLWAQVLDVPHADKLAQVLTEMAPDAVKAILKPEGGNTETTAQLTAKVQQMTQALQEAIALAHEAQGELQQAKDEAEAREAEVRIKAYEAETKRLQVTGANQEQVQAIVMQLLGDMARTAMPVEGTEGPGPDETPMHEGGEQYQMQPFPAGESLMGAE